MRLDILNSYSRLLVTSVCCLMLLTSDANATWGQNNGDTIVVFKQQTSRKHGIKLYPDASHQVLFFGAKGQYGRAYQLFLFDVEGKLMRQVNIKNNQTTVLEEMEKGDYVFEVFSDDERIETGQVRVR